MILAFTVVSVPMLLDHTDTPAVLAVRISIRAVLANSGRVALWEVPVTAVLLLDCLPLSAGQAIAMPVLGYATGHLDRKPVACASWSAAPPRTRWGAYAGSATAPASLRSYARPSGSP